MATSQGSMQSLSHLGCTVFNLATGNEQVFCCDPRKAVIAAYAQSLGDWNTWDYAKKYDHLVESGNDVFCCGDFSTFIDPIIF